MELVSRILRPQRLFTESLKKRLLFARQLAPRLLSTHATSGLSTLRPNESAIVLPTQSRDLAFQTFTALLDTAAPLFILSKVAAVFGSIVMRSH